MKKKTDTKKNAANPATSGAKTPAAAAAFAKEAETKLGELSIKLNRAEWIHNNFITDDTEALAAEVNEENTAYGTEAAEKAAQFNGVKTDYDTRRKLDLLKLALTIPAPKDPKLRKELTEITTRMEGMYGKGKYCPPGKKDEKGQPLCLPLGKLERILAESRNPDELKEAWVGWHQISKPIKKDYVRFVELANQGAREMGFKDLGAMWRSNYDMPPDDFAKEQERIWQQVKPLYDSLHAYVRNQLAKKYGADMVPAGKPIPAHLLGNMWSQQWGNIYDLTAPTTGGDPGYDLTKILKERNTDAKQMVKYGEAFFVSLGLPQLPPTFWERSLFVKPADREVVCHASAWDIDNQDDVRIKMCIEITEEDFNVIHHELGHNYYQVAYKHQSPLYQNSANDGFHEALGDTIALSVTPEYLKKLGFIQTVPPESADIGLLLHRALDKVAFLPFGYLVDQWRWKVFSGEVTPENYNKAWWELRTKYQGIAPPNTRTEEDFDPGAKFHVPANTPYARYFLAHILQFQFHRALCKEAGYTGPLHRCSIYGSKAAGAKLHKMMEMGQSRPWPEALKALTGEDRMDGEAILDYFAPLKKWLDEQNAKSGAKTGW